MFDPATSSELHEALILADTARSAHDQTLGRDHPWTKGSARVTADALGRTEEAATLRERYGINKGNADGA